MIHNLKTPTGFFPKTPALAPPAHSDPECVQGQLLGTTTFSMGTLHVQKGTTLALSLHDLQWQTQPFQNQRAEMFRGDLELQACRATRRWCKVLNKNASGAWSAAHDWAKRGTRKWKTRIRMMKSSHYGRIMKPSRSKISVALTSAPRHPCASPPVNWPTIVRETLKGVGQSCRVLGPVTWETMQQRCHDLSHSHVVPRGIHDGLVGIRREVVTTKSNTLEQNLPRTLQVGNAGNGVPQFLPALQSFLAHLLHECVLHTPSPNSSTPGGQTPFWFHTRVLPACKRIPRGESSSPRVLYPERVVWLRHNERVVQECHMAPRNTWSYAPMTTRWQWSWHHVCLLESFEHHSWDCCSREILGDTRQHLQQLDIVETHLKHFVGAPSKACSGSSGRTPK